MRKGDISFLANPLLRFLSRMAERKFSTMSYFPLSNWYENAAPDEKLILTHDTEVHEIYYQKGSRREKLAELTEATVDFSAPGGRSFTATRKGDTYHIAPKGDSQ